MPTLVEQVHARLCAQPGCDRLGQRFCEVEGCDHKFCFPHVERCPNCRGYICGGHWDAHLADCPAPEGETNYPAQGYGPGQRYA